ncbi:MAG: outer membrane lipoprotein LolB [Gammaproteobacteria bacterium]|nr:outer membrane lipoprotein LolB [Gammaproteobacteria bacterium]
MFSKPYLPVKYIILYLITAPFLFGCSLFGQSNVVNEPLSIEARNSFLSKQDNWTLTGRIGITSQKESNSANISWQKRGDAIELRIYGGLGTTYALLTSSPSGSKIELSDDQVFYGNDPQELLWRTTGWNIPVVELQKWILGLTYGAPSFQLNDQGLVDSITFNSWQLSFQKYAVFSGLDLPKKLRAEHPDVTLKFAIYNWEFAK